MIDKHLAVLLTVFNRRDLTVKCLQRLYEQKIPENVKMEVYLTDDGSTDGTKKAVLDNFPQVHVIDGDGSLFWNRGMWTAWDVARNDNDYDYYLWLNDDTYIYDKCIMSLLKCCIMNDNKAIIVGACQSSNHKGMTYGGQNKKRDFVKPNGSIDERIAYFNGNIVLIPIYIYHKLGNLNYKFRHSRGDIDYGFRANKKGLLIIQYRDYLGECDLHNRPSSWCDPKVPIQKRIKCFYQPTGMRPSELFYSERRMLGIIPACFHILTIHIRLLFPWIWIMLNKGNRETPK